MKRCSICARAFPADERFCSIHGIPLVEEQVELRGEAGDLTGLVLDRRYRLAGVIGKGGMGLVYEAENLRIGRRCAVKVLHQRLVADPKMRTRLYREVQATSRVRHPNVVEIDDYGEDERAGSYLVMEYLEGTTLSRVLRARGRLSLGESCAVTCQVAAALAATHAAGLIHRDLKPGNVMILTNGQVKILDFGLIRALEPEDHDEIFTVTTDGIVFGTPWYMSPEQAAGQPLDARSDVYSLGVIFYEMLVGRPPFDDEKALDVLEAHRHRPVPLPSALAPRVDLPALAEALLLKALAKDPAERFGSMTQLMDAVFALADREGVPMGSVELGAGALAARRPEAKARGLAAARGLALGPQSPSATLERLQELGRQRMAELIDRTVDQMREVFPRYRSSRPEALRAQVATVIASAVDLLTAGSREAAPAEAFDKLLGRVGSAGSPTEPIATIWICYSAGRPIVRDAAEGDLARYALLEDELDRALLPLIFRLVDRYVDGSQARLVELNEQLRCQNDELQGLRQSLGEQVRDAAVRLARAESLAARVVESISSGLLLVERGSHRVLLWNPALERLSGLSSASVVGRPVEEALQLAEGVPLAEFLESVRLHGEVGLRKLRVSFAGAEPRAVYVRGQPLLAPGGDRIGTLFTVDDVTEREQIIESFRRFLSRDLVDGIMRDGERGEAPDPARRAVVLALDLRDEGGEGPPPSAEERVGLRADAVRVVADAVLRRGGTIERLDEGLSLVSFVPAGDAPAAGPAVAAAAELAQRIASVNRRRQGSGLAPLRVGVGLAGGEVLTLEARGARGSVHTVARDAVERAAALAAAAADGVVLAEAQVHGVAGGGERAAPASRRVVPLQGGGSVEAVVVEYDATDLPPPEPITMAAPRRDR